MPSFDILINRISIFKNADINWYVIGGWAIDCHLGKVSREHSDVEISVFIQDQTKLFELIKDYSPKYIVPPAGNTDNYQSIVWSGEVLKLPIHQLRIETPNFQLDIMLSPMEGENWVFRREPTIKRKLDSAILTKKIQQTSVNYLAPELILLFKAKYLRSKDQSDFQNIVTNLDIEKKSWLKQSIQMVYGKDHSWLSSL